MEDLVVALTLGLAAGVSPGPLLALVVSATLERGFGAGLRVASAPLVTDLPIILACVSVLRSVVVDSTLQNSNESSFDPSLDDPFAVDPPSNTKHNYRIHGHSDLNFAARNVLINSGMMFAGLEDGFADPPLDHIGHMWVNDNTFHHRVPDLFNPKETIDVLVARGNVALRSRLLSAGAWWTSLLSVPVAPWALTAVAASATPEACRNLRRLRSVLIFIFGAFI